MLFLMQVAPPTVLLHSPRSLLHFIVQFLSSNGLTLHCNHTKNIFLFIIFAVSVCSLVDHAMQVVHEEFGIVEGLMTTVHATTGWFRVLQSICYLLL
jgi:hypothetical protein